MELEFPRHIRKILKYQIPWKSVQWEPSCSMRTDRQTDRHDEANSRFSQFCERAWKLYNLYPVFMHIIVVWISKTTATYTALPGWFSQHRRSVYCAVRAEYLNVIQVNLTLWNVKHIAFYTAAWCPYRSGDPEKAGLYFRFSIKHFLRVNS